MTSRQSFWADLFAKFMLRQRVYNCYCRAFDKNAGDPDFLYNADILSIGGHLRCDLEL